ncbi:hypothetical protein BDN67DRAFT_133798 [Paxillus ammoniavirescens]|nr:hypothetical protein BDN67DRAFT_133798 [Paxillus ammoniavirescens]
MRIWDINGQGAFYVPLCCIVLCILSKNEWTIPALNARAHNDYPLGEKWSKTISDDAPGCHKAEQAEAEAAVPMIRLAHLC